ncbi:hypothetical protein ADUPG1_006791, partial [Aduncisulcus paluster]
MDITSIKYSKKKDKHKKEPTKPREYMGKYVYKSLSENITAAREGGAKSGFVTSLAKKLAQSESQIRSLKAHLYSVEMENASLKERLDKVEENEDIFLELESLRAFITFKGLDDELKFYCGASLPGASKPKSSIITKKLITPPRHDDRDIHVQVKQIDTRSRSTSSSTSLPFSSVNAKAPSQIIRSQRPSSANLRLRVPLPTIGKGKNKIHMMDHKPGYSQDRDDKDSDRFEVRQGSHRRSPMSARSNSNIPLVAPSSESIASSPPSGESSTINPSSSVSSKSEASPPFSWASDKHIVRITPIDELPGGSGRMPEKEETIPNLPFDLISQKLDHLNKVTGQGEKRRFVQSSAGSKHFVMASLPTVQILFFKNGCVVGDHEFCAYNSAAGALTIRDISGGFLPRQLARDYPEGCIIDYKVYKDTKHGGCSTILGKFQRKYDKENKDFRFQQRWKGEKKVIGKEGEEKGKAVEKQHKQTFETGRKEGKKYKFELGESRCLNQENGKQDLGATLPSVRAGRAALQREMERKKHNIEETKEGESKPKETILGDISLNPSEEKEEEEVNSEDM